MFVSIKILAKNPLLTSILLRIRPDMQLMCKYTVQFKKRDSRCFGFQNFARTHSPTRLMSSENTYSLSKEHCNLKYSGKWFWESLQSILIIILHAADIKIDMHILNLCKRLAAAFFSGDRCTILRKINKWRDFFLIPKSIKNKFFMVYVARFYRISW